MSLCFIVNVIIGAIINQTESYSKSILVIVTARARSYKSEARSAICLGAGNTYIH